MAGWHHCFNRLEFEQVPRVSDRQGSLAYCSPWGHSESDMTESLNRTELKVESAYSTDKAVLCKILLLDSVLFSSVAQSCLTLCVPMNYSMPGLPVHQQLPESTQTHVH